MKEPVVCSSSSFVMDPDAPVVLPPQKFVEGCKTDARAVARRRRIEIRRFRIKANSGSFLEPVCKRSRSSLSGFFVVPPVALSSTTTRSYEAGTDFSSRLMMSSEENMSSGAPMGGQELLNVGHSRSGSEDSVSSSANQDAYSRTASKLCSDRSGSDGDASRASPSTITTEASSSSDPPSSSTATAAAAQGQQQLVAAAATSSSSSRSLVCAASDRCPPHGVVFICGRRREMEDAVSVVPSFMSVPCRTVGGCDCSSALQAMEEDLSTLHFFGVFDGHGGSQVASFCKEHMHRAVMEQLRAVAFGSVNGRPENIEAQVHRAMAVSFRQMDAQVGGFCYRGDSHSSSSPSDFNAIAPETVGSTAVVAVVGSNRIIVANCGDSRAVLSRGGQAIPLSQDHKPNRDDELARVEAAGGRVIFWNGHRVLGVLAMSRAIGDRYLKPYIIAEPDVTCTERTEEDECLILASDGLWDVLSNELVCEIARKCLAGRQNRNQGGEEGEESAADMAAALLAKVAFAKGSSDNISVVVVDLRPRRR